MAGEGGARRVATQILARVERSGSIVAAAQVAAGLIAAAKARLGVLLDSSSKAALASIADAVLTRRA